MNLSPAAQMFWGSIIRHFLTLVAGMLVTHGYVSQTGASAYVEELVGAALYGATNVWANRVAYWQRIKQLIGHAMPAGSTDVQVEAKVADLAEVKALPSVFTPADVTVSLVKP